jgi:hypothetical protein
MSAETFSLRYRCVKRSAPRFGRSKAAKPPNRINKLKVNRYLDTVEVWRSSRHGPTMNRFI